MMIAPIIFCTVVTGIAGMENMKEVGKTGVLALLYFEVVSTLALIVGLVIVNVVQPGAGMNVDVSHARRQGGRDLRQGGRAAERHRLPAERHSHTIVDAFAKGDILQVLLFSVLFGFALHAVGERARPIFDFIDRFARCCSASSA